MTSPIPSEDLQATGPASIVEDTKMITMEEPTITSVPTSVRKRKKRRKKHKGEPRREEQATAAGGGEPEPCELSSDEENGGHWCVAERKSFLLCFFVRFFLSFSLLVCSLSTFSVTKENVEQHREHSPASALEWDSYPFSDGDWTPCNL